MANHWLEPEEYCNISLSDCTGERLRIDTNGYFVRNKLVEIEEFFVALSDFCVEFVAQTPQVNKFRPDPGVSVALSLNKQEKLRVHEDGRVYCLDYLLGTDVNIFDTIRYLVEKHHRSW